MNFYINKFHNDYDGLIGNNILIPLKSKIDFENETLNLENKTVKLHFKNVDINRNSENKQISIPVAQKSGMAYVKEQALNENIIVKEGIYNVENFRINANVDIKNRGSINNSFKPLQAEVVSEEDFEIIEDSENRPLSEQIRTDHLNKEEMKALCKVISQYKHIFYQEDSDLSFTNAIKHQIRTTDDVPIHVRSYRYPYIHKEEVKKQINEMLNKGIIKPSNSPYSAPVWVVPKKMDASGRKKWRIVIDYRRLNEVTVDDKYPIPNIDEILEKLGRCQYFTTLDLAKGFHQIEIDGRDTHKTAFSVENGHYEFLRMPFGLKTAPATFQRLMNNVLNEFINKICLVYMDDIIIYSTSLQEHIDSLNKIFKRLSEVNLKIQLDKSEFLKRETEFLGHIVTRDGIKPNPKKIECVKNFPIPKTQKQIKQFLGLTGFYRKFIKDYSLIAKPITKYLKRDAKLRIDDPEYLHSIDSLKRLLITEPILRYPNFNKTFTITTDASQFALGAVLSQDEHPICFASRTLNDHEQRYSTIEKELLAIVWAVKYFRPYVFGRRFLIETDHKPLQWLFSLKEPNSRLFRWKIKLSEYDYEIRYKKGAKNGNADALSRIEVNLVDDHEEQQIQTSKSPLNIFKNQIAIIKTNSGSLKIKNVKIFNKSRKLIYTKILDNETAITLLKSHFNPKGLNAIYVEDREFLRVLENTFRNHFANSGQLKIIKCDRMLEDVLDEEKLAQIIEKEHLENNHRGITEVYNELLLKYYHPKLRTRITQFINNCEICNIEKYDRKPTKCKYQITETPTGPTQVIHIDVFYTLEKTLFLTFIDKFNKYAQAIKINGRSWVEFKRALLQYIATVGKMNKIIVDNELGFKALPLKEFLKNEGIEIHYTSNYNHTSNADVERLHNTLNEHIRLLRHDNNKDIDTVEEKMFKIIQFYNNSIHSTTNKKPIDFIKGKIKDEEYPEIHQRISKIKERVINKLNKNREDTEIEPGTSFIKDSRGGKNHAKFKKLEIDKIDENHFRDKETGLKYFKSHIRQKKKFQNTLSPTIKAKHKQKKTKNNPPIPGHHADASSVSNVSNPPGDPLSNTRNTEPEQ